MLTSCDCNTRLPMVVSRVCQFWKCFKWTRRAVTVSPRWFIIPVFEADEDFVLTVSTSTAIHREGQIAFFDQLTTIDNRDLTSVGEASEKEHFPMPNNGARSSSLSSRFISESNFLWFSPAERINYYRHVGWFSCVQNKDPLFFTDKASIGICANLFSSTVFSFCRALVDVHTFQVQVSFKSNGASALITWCGHTLFIFRASTIFEAVSF